MWLLSDGSSAPTQNLNIPPVVLLLPSPFNDEDDGTYTCSPNSMLNDASSDTITLNLASEYVRSYVYMLLLIFII